MSKVKVLDLTNIFKCELVYEVIEKASFLKVKITNRVKITFFFT
jgi:hypothetical protein